MWIGTVYVVHAGCMTGTTGSTKLACLANLKQVKLSKARRHLHIYISTTHTAAGGKPPLNVGTFDVMSVVLLGLVSSSFCMVPSIGLLSKLGQKVVQQSSITLPKQLYKLYVGH